MQPVQVGLFIGLVASFGRLNRYRRQSHEGISIRAFSDIRSFIPSKCTAGDGRRQTNGTQQQAIIKENSRSMDKYGRLWMEIWSGEGNRITR